MLFRFGPRKNWQEKIFERVFKDRKLCVDRLIPFGFVQEKKGFSYRAELMSGMYYVEFDIDVDGLIDVSLQAVGEMSDMAQKSSASYMDKKLREEYEDELWHVAECCYEPDVFKNEMTQRVISHIRATYGEELEYLWRKFPRNAVVRRKDNRKWYVALLVVPQLKLTGSSEEEVEVINLRINPEELGGYVDNISRFPGYHMNKNNWVSIILDGSVSFEELIECIEASYRLALK